MHFHRCRRDITVCIGLCVSLSIIIIRMCLCVCHYADGLNIHRPSNPARHSFYLSSLLFLCIQFWDSRHNQRLLNKFSRRISCKCLISNIQKCFFFLLCDEFIIFCSRSCLTHSFFLWAILLKNDESSNEKNNHTITHPSIHQTNETKSVWWNEKKLKEKKENVDKRLYSLRNKICRIPRLKFGIKWYRKWVKKQVFF